MCSACWQHCPRAAVPFFCDLCRGFVSCMRRGSWNSSWVLSVRPCCTGQGGLGSSCHPSLHALCWGLLVSRGAVLVVKDARRFCPHRCTGCSQSGKLRERVLFQATCLKLDPFTSLHLRHLWTFKWESCRQQTVVGSGWRLGRYGTRRRLVGLAEAWSSLLRPWSPARSGPPSHRGSRAPHTQPEAGSAQEPLVTWCEDVGVAFGCSPLGLPTAFFRQPQ